MRPFQPLIKDGLDCTWEPHRNPCGRPGPGLMHCLQNLYQLFIREPRYYGRSHHPSRTTGVRKLTDNYAAAILGEFLQVAEKEAATDADKPRD